MRMDNSMMTYDDDGEAVLISSDVRYRIKRSKDTIIRIEVRREANGPSLLEARATAKKILYSYSLSDNTLVLDDFLTSEGKSRFKDQEVRVTLYVPKGTFLTYSSDSGGQKK